MLPFTAGGEGGWLSDCFNVVTARDQANTLEKGIFAEPQLQSDAGFVFEHMYLGSHVQY
jgi:hypothetical protein